MQHQLGPVDKITHAFVTQQPFNISSRNMDTRMHVIRLEGPEDPYLRNSSFGGHVTTLTLQYLWPRPPGVWLGGPGCKPGAQRAVIAVDPQLNSLGMDSRTVISITSG